MNYKKTLLVLCGIGTLWSVRQSTQLASGKADPFLILLAVWIVLITFFHGKRLHLR